MVWDIKKIIKMKIQIIAFNLKKMRKLEMYVSDLIIAPLSVGELKL